MGRGGGVDGGDADGCRSRRNRCALQEGGRRRPSRSAELGVELHAASRPQARGSTVVVLASRRCAASRAPTTTGPDVTVEIFKVERYFSVGVTPHPFILVPLVGGSCPRSMVSAASRRAPQRLLAGGIVPICLAASFFPRHVLTEGRRWPLGCRLAATTPTGVGRFLPWCRRAPLLARPYPAAIASLPFPQAPLRYSIQGARDIPRGSVLKQEEQEK